MQQLMLSLLCEIYICFSVVQELENFVRSRKADNKAQISVLSQQLVSNHIMETSVKKELDEYQTRSQDLDKQVSYSVV